MTAPPFTPTQITAIRAIAREERREAGVRAVKRLLAGDHDAALLDAAGERVADAVEQPLDPIGISESVHGGELLAGRAGGTDKLEVGLDQRAAGEDENRLAAEREIASGEGAVVEFAPVEWHRFFNKLGRADRPFRLQASSPSVGGRTSTDSEGGGAGKLAASPGAVL